VVVVPFPFTDKTSTKRRPALILSNGGSFNDKSSCSVLAMITSARHSSRPLDNEISDLDSAGLTSESIIRMKLFTLDNDLILRKAGHLADNDQKVLNQHLINYLATSWIDEVRLAINEDSRVSVMIDSFIYYQ
jgi:mRNA interferase MazF